MTGAAGFVGAAVVRQALAEGWQVTGVTRRTLSSRLEGLEHPAFAVEVVDLRDRDAVSALLGRTRPEVVAHIAWAGVENKSRFDRDQITQNIDATLSLLDAAAAVGARKFIGFGSQGEYGPIGGRISENDLPAPTTMYGAAKLATYHLTRQVAAQVGMEFAWMRLFSTYGPGDNPGWLIPMMIQTMLRGQTADLTEGTQKWDYLYVDDVASAVTAVAATPTATGLFNLGSGEPVQIRGLVEMIRDIIDPGLTLNFGAVPFRPDQVMHMEADNLRLRTATGWTPKVGLEQGLRQTIAAAR